ncbi:uncharacterized protein PV09_08261 [Verruconis gallopava]|uniref:Zn(2)-C6 fungal-type domain-containing protein n=1 Tax=Verruconis gallopava TaxID=253628 RepID=A0A0D1XDA8_9PEZI|nr:uncharacterized protein PV09_08261 [Verruconis gallopava]KIW00221.1 hypothetical protein PV09_08261 [Verruconis gallopava]
MDPASRRVPLDKRKRTETSCDRCKARKQKCDRLLDQDQCRYCQLHNIACTTTVPRKRRIYGSVEGVGSRITLLESLVKGLLPEANLSTIASLKETGKSLGIPLPQVDDGDAPTDEAEKPPADGEEDTAIQVIPDGQKQMQYVGPSSSFLFHLNLRRLLGNYSIFEFALFGNNAADQIFEISKTPGMSQTMNIMDRRGSSMTISDCGSPSDAVREIDGPVLETLMDAYFEVIHSDFPVLHENSFRESYEVWAASNTTSDPVWLCKVLCVLILARRVASIEIPEEAQKKWWTHVQTLLPSVLFSSNIYTVQALMLAALHLHNTNHRDACWNLTGTAVRVAHAIGLHREDIKQNQPRLAREHRKQVWWTLYAFEQMQVSSFDRPSAISHIASSVGVPNERILGTAGYYPPDYNKWYQKLQIILGSACKALNPGGNSSSVKPEDAYNRPLSPTAAILRDLDRWKDGLPTHLRLDAANSLAPAAQRPLLLLFIEYYYILVLITRSALLRRAVLSTQNPPEHAMQQALITVSETCIDAGKSLGQLLRKMDNIQKFNATTWFDIFFTVASALVLVLDIRVNQDRHGPNSESRTVLRDLAAIVTRHLGNPRVPGSMQALGKIVVEVNATAEQSGRTQLDTPTSAEAQMPPSSPAAMPTTPAPSVQYSPRTQIGTPSSIHNLLAYPVDPNMQPDPNAQYRGQLYDPQTWTQLSFMDDPTQNWQDWTWDDIETIVRR